MAKPLFVELGEMRNLTRIPILYEDRSVMAIDKPAGWLLVPFNWQRTQRNLQAAITSSIAAGDFWARSRSLKFLKNIHRLDGDTTGILLMAKSVGAVDSYGDLFESRKMEKTYLVVVHGIPKQREWTCSAKIAQDPREIGRMMVDEVNGKESETAFKVVTSHGPYSLVEAYPLTGRTHQIRIHLLASGYPVVGDDTYGPDASKARQALSKKRVDYPMGLRAMKLSFFDPFLRKMTHITAPTDEFIAAFGFKTPKAPVPAPTPAPIVPPPTKA